MIDPITGAALTAELAGLTSSMTGLSLADAWSQQGFVDPVDAGYGVDFGVNTVIKGKAKGAISGDTSQTIDNSSEPDPVDAFHDYVENEVGVVSEISGGVVEGSTTGTFVYSLMEKYEATPIVEAVAPIAVPLQKAYMAIAKVFGVAMDCLVLSPELSDKFINALKEGEGNVYDKDKELIKAWWDGQNVLLPESALQAIYDVLQEEGIGGSGYSYDGTEVTVGNYTYTLTGSSATVALNSDEFTPLSDGYSYRLRRRTTDPDPVTGNFRVASPCWDGGEVEKGVASSDDWNSDQGASSSTGSGHAQFASTPSGYKAFRLREAAGTVINISRSSTAASKSQNTFAYLLFTAGTPSGEYPEGTAASPATHYTPSTMPVVGGIAVSDSDTVDVVPVNIPDDPTSTIGSDTDPTSPTNPDTESELPAPPIPLPIPDTNVSNPDVPLVDSSVVNTELIDELVEELANTLDPQPEQSSGLIPVPPLPGIPDGHGGYDYPSIVPASGSGLVHVYNPTPAEFVSFGNWLWVTYADSTIDKIWNNPFDGIIGAFELYATPQTDGTDNIRSGFLVCPTTAALVRQRYTEIDCGTIIVPEFYGNYLDYSPYSQAYVYLPFIGINEVSIDDIAGHAINIRYRIDAYNGSCIAMIYVAKDGYRNLCYQFAGNCAVEVPLAGGSQAAIKAGMMQAEAYSRAGIANAALSGAAAIGAGLATGGLAGALMGGLSMLGGVAGAWYSGQRSIDAARVANKSTVQHSGQFGASHGAMGLKVPHIMIRNPIQVKVVNYNKDYGFPAHKRVIIGGCTGYLRVREVNVISAHATDEEKMAIEAALKNGVYVS